MSSSDAVGLGKVLLLASLLTLLDKSLNLGVEIVVLAHIKQTQHAGELVEQIQSMLYQCAGSTGGGAAIGVGVAHEVKDTGDGTCGVQIVLHGLDEAVAVGTQLIGAGLLAPRVTGTALRSMKAPGTAYDDDVLGKDPQPATMDDYVHTGSDGYVADRCG